MDHDCINIKLDDQKDFLFILIPFPLYSFRSLHHAVAVLSCVDQLGYFDQGRRGR